MLSVLSAVLLDFLLIGFGIATLGWCAPARTWQASIDLTTLPCEGFPRRRRTLTAGSATRRFLANRFLRKQNLPQHAVEQHVEWWACSFALPRLLDAAP